MFLVFFIWVRATTLLIGLRENFSPVELTLLLVIPGLIELAFYTLLLRQLRERLPSQAWRVLAFFANFIYVLFWLVDLKTLAAFHRGVDSVLLSEAVSALTPANAFELMDFLDFTLLGATLLTFLFPHRWSFRLGTKRFWVVLTGLTLLCFFFWMTLSQTKTPVTAFVSPFLRIPLLRVALLVGSHERTAEHLSQLTISGIKFAPTPNQNQRELQTKTVGKPLQYNILLIVLESTGARYVFDASLTKSGQVPMPFLKKLSEESLFLTKHYSTSNSSPRALFSLFTGLYPEPTLKFFSLDKSLKIKTWNAYLEGYTKLFVTPSPTEWYFPKGLLNNNGIKEILGQDKLLFKERKTSPREARNEEQVADYFVSRLKHLKEPFFATYIPFAPHFPYHDYGKQWRITAGTSRLDRYVDNLHLVDVQIEKFFRALEERGILDKTLVVLVGDHSEAFRQHRGNYIHSLYSYDENLHVPALIWAKNLLTPRKILEPTSHVDIAPTILDILRIPHDATKFQGVSLLNKITRPFVFAYGNEGVVTVYDKAQKKFQRLADASCRFFDLAKDSAEKLPQVCDRKNPAYEQATAYWLTQLAYLKGLQNAAKFPAHAGVR